MSFCAAILVIGFGFTTGLANTAMATVANWFVRRRALALGLLMVGSGLGGTLVPILVVLIGSLGWRNAALAIGLGAWVLLLPLGLVIRHRPEQYGWYPDGDPAPARVAVQPGSVDRTRVTRGELHDRSGYPDAILLDVRAELQPGNGHPVRDRRPHDPLPDLHRPAREHRRISSRLAYHFQFGRAPRRRMACRSGEEAAPARGAVRAPGGGHSGLRHHDRSWQIALFLLLYAPAYGGIIPLRPAILADFFGRRSIGAVQGDIAGFTSLAAVVGPVFAGWTFDVTQSYRTAYILLGVVTAAALPVILALEKPGSRAETRSEASSSQT